MSGNSKWLSAKQKSLKSYDSRLFVDFDISAESEALEPSPQSRFKRIFLVIFCAYSLLTHYTINLIF